ncbi:hypothetical protein [Caulobacter hibisci]|uniref:Uncharacterized protein n=1 Tax=Caulobacter hibisci TaxID=2035993 RepID=A0ABS0SUF1_9CAUL|nr:hypothetical protein [Caulobacter hibisci]MBI1683231.1 hypothetical protein [Caulobacter hibisci]
MSCACGQELDFEDTGPDGLARGERLLLWGLRTWAALRLQGRPAEAAIRSAFARSASPRTASLFLQTMMLVESDLVRPLQIQCPHCAGYGLDEQRLVTACGLAAAAPGLASRLLAPLVARPDVTAVLARALNHALALDGAPLPVRMGEPVEDAQPLRMATIH